MVEKSFLGEFAQLSDASMGQTASTNWPTSPSRPPPCERNSVSSGRSTGDRHPTIVFEVATLMQQRLIVTQFDSYDINEVTVDLDSFAIQPHRIRHRHRRQRRHPDQSGLPGRGANNRQAVGHHPGLLILDEPRQAIEFTDYAPMLQHLARGTADHGQVNITSAAA
jgi:hypothetical protein